MKKLAATAAILYFGCNLVYGGNLIVQVMLIKILGIWFDLTKSN